MAWYDKYMTIYGKPFNEVPHEVIDEIREKLALQQSSEPLVSIVVCAYNEGTRLAANLWSLSELRSTYPLEIIGVNNNSNDSTEEIYKTLGVTYFNETRQSPGYARQCGLQNAKGKYHFYIDADTLYPACYVNIMMEKLILPDVVCVSTFWSFFPIKPILCLVCIFTNSSVIFFYGFSILIVQNFVFVVWSWPLKQIMQKK